MPACRTLKTKVDTAAWVLSEEGNYLFMSKGNNTTTGDPQ